jgi:hypothetical protein
MKTSVTKYLLWGMLMIFISGLFMGVTYFVMDYTEEQFRGMDCEIENNIYFDNCQDMFELSVYPFFMLKNIIVWFNYFFIFALILGMLVVGYNAGKSPVLIGMLLIFCIFITYVSIELSNAYRTMIENPLFYSMMTEFTIYNKIMLNFPAFIGIISILSVLLSITNFQKARVNNPTSDLDY